MESFDWKRIIFMHYPTIRSWILSTPNQEQSIHRRVIHIHSCFKTAFKSQTFVAAAANLMLPDLLNLNICLFYPFTKYPESCRDTEKNCNSVPTYAAELLLRNNYSLLCAYAFISSRLSFHSFENARKIRLDTLFSKNIQIHVHWIGYHVPGQG